MLFPIFRTWQYRDPDMASVFSCAIRLPCSNTTARSALCKPIPSLLLVGVPLIVKPL